MFEEIATMSSELATGAATLATGNWWESEVFLNIIFIALYVWTIVWKGLALWRAAQLKQKIWFVIFMLPINTLGVLEIIYLFLIAKSPQQAQAPAEKTKAISGPKSDKNKKKSAQK